MKLRLREQDRVRAAGARVDFGELALQNKFKCPDCHSIVYSRKSGFCGVCGGALPSNFLFNGFEKLRVQALLEFERARHRAWLLKRNAVHLPILAAQ